MASYEKDEEVKPYRAPSLRELRLVSARLREKIRHEKAIKRETDNIAKLLVKLNGLRDERKPI